MFYNKKIFNLLIDCKLKTNICHCRSLSQESDSYSRTDPPIQRHGATVRERSRMHTLNEAFEELRQVVPKSNLSEHQRLSKIATLRLAIHYISALNAVLTQTSGQHEHMDAGVGYDAGVGCASKM